MRLRGKFIGGVLGACFGGPIGVALGVAIGHVCDSVSDSSESSLAARSKFLELACEGISKIAKADGRVSEGEIAEIEKIFAEMRLDSETREKAVGHFRRSKIPAKLSVALRAGSARCFRAPRRARAFSYSFCAWRSATAT